VTSPACRNRDVRDRPPAPVAQGVPASKRLGEDAVRKLDYSQQYAARVAEPVKEEKKEKKKEARREDIVHIEWHEGMVLGDNRSPTEYKVRKLLGDGTFGRVLECDRRRRNGEKERVAVKVIRDVKKYVEAAKIEARVLERLRHLAHKQKHDETGCVELYDYFSYKTHLCLVFEPLGTSLYEFLKQNKFRGFRVEDVRSFMWQILRALTVVHGMHLTHTDLKPENVLLVESGAQLVDVAPGRGKNHGEKIYRPKSSRVKLIDFGGATFADEHHSAIINTRQYRAPEVTLGLRWDESSDLWSAGCLGAELYTGRMLFPTHENREHLAMMERIIEPIPSRMYRPDCKYMRHGRLDWPAEASDESRRSVEQCSRISNLFLPRHKILARGFLEPILRIEPRLRPTAREALSLELFTEPLPEE